MSPEDWAALLRDLRGRGFVVVAHDQHTEIIVIRPITTR